MMYSVRIDKDGDGYVFKVQPCDGTFEMTAMDSAPGIIAMVRADDPSQACQIAWRRASHMHDDDFKPLSVVEALRKLTGDPRLTLEKVQTDQGEIMTFGRLPGKDEP